MKKNLGSADRYIRVLIGVSFLLNIIIIKPGAIGTVILLALGLGILYSAYSGYCFIYDLLKISTCNKNCESESNENAS